MDSAGVQPKSISEAWGERVTRSVALRILCGAWLLPAASLIWIGLAATGLRRTDEASLVLALGRTQATSVVLALLTVLVGATAFVRRAESIALDAPVADPARPDLRWTRSHVAAGAVALPAVAIGALAESISSYVLPVAALLGLFAAMILPRALLGCRGAWSGPLAALAVGGAFQLTIGWLPLIHPGGTSSPVLAVEGLLLAWAAAAATRVDPFSPAEEAHSAEQPAVVRPAELVASTGPFSRGSAQPSIPEAVVGR